MTLRDGTELGCIGRCKVCGKAIQLRITTFFQWEPRQIVAGHNVKWGHFTTTDHPAELSPGVLDVNTPMGGSRE